MLLNVRHESPQPSGAATGPDQYVTSSGDEFPLRQQPEATGQRDAEMMSSLDDHVKNLGSLPFKATIIFCPHTHAVDENIAFMCHSEGSAETVGHSVLVR